MLAIWTGTTYQFNPPEWLIGAVEPPVISAPRSSGEAVYLKYPLYRLTLLGVAVAVGIALWLFLNRTRIGLTVRPGVTHRHMVEPAAANPPHPPEPALALAPRLPGFRGRGRG